MLLVEYLDRLTRQEVDIAISVISQLIRLGIVIHVITPSKQQVYDMAALKDAGKLLTMVCELLAAFNEVENRKGKIQDGVDALNQPPSRILEHDRGHCHRGSGSRIVIRARAKTQQLAFCWNPVRTRSTTTEPTSCAGWYGKRNSDRSRKSMMRSRNNQNVIYGVPAEANVAELNGRDPIIYKLINNPAICGDWGIRRKGGCRVRKCVGQQNQTPW